MNICYKFYFRNKKYYSYSYSYSYSYLRELKSQINNFIIKLLILLDNF